MSDFPKGPQVPLPGAPNYIASQGDNASNHPALQNTAPDSIQDWDQTPAIRHVLENTAEREGISFDEAMRQLKAGADDMGGWYRPTVGGTFPQYEDEGEGDG